MSVEMQIVGNGKYGGSQSSISSYSATEDSTPLDPGDTTGGTGTIDFSAKDDPTSFGSILLLNDTIILTDSGAGNTTGKVERLTMSNGSVTVSGSGRLNLLNVEVFVPPLNTTLSAAVTQILGLAGITTNISVEPAIASISVYAMSGKRNLWVFLKEMCTAHQTEIALVGNKIVVREPRQRNAFLGKITEASLNVANGQLAQNVEAAYHNYTQISNALVYPYGGWNDEVSVYQVDASEERIINIPVDVSLTSIDQPTMVTFVDRDYTGPASVYAVAGNDGLPISPTFWADKEGSLTVAIGEDGNSIDVTLKGATEEGFAPYQIAVSAGGSNNYSSLRLVGSGLGYKREILKTPTGAPPAKTAQDVGITIENPWISTLNDAKAAALRAGGKFAAATQTISIGATFINRLAEGKVSIYPTFADYNDTIVGLKFSGFDTAWSGQTFADFNEVQLDQVRDDFANQVFGNIGGARVVYGDAMYRIRSATKNAEGISGATAEADTIFSDFNTTWVGGTFADFDTKFDTLKFEDFSLIPLAR